VSKAVGIDYGVKRTGIAITDSLKIIASGLTTIETKKLLFFISELTQKEDIDFFVIGYPVNLQNKKNDIIKDIDIIIDKLKTKYPSVPIHKIDERYTSKIAKNTLINSGTKKIKRRNKKIIDQISATIILQDYLDYYL
tara:strand:- start:319 stop:732 length:414 start_codon:yes stop_codon:yes gene_type:complete